MNSEIRNCQNCRQAFVIDPADFDFYRKIDVPPPTFCPQCRFERRLSFFNPITLYKRRCDLCGKDSVSTYRPEVPHTVYCPRCWWSDAWDPLDYGIDYDFTRNFFEQINEQWRRVPLLGLSEDPTSLEYSPYAHDVGYLKNCYLLFMSNEDEDCACGYQISHSRLTLDSSMVSESELLYDCMHSYRANRCVGARCQLANSIECLFCRDCMNCQNCFGCANLRNKKYCIFNQQYTKEEYYQEISKYDLGSYGDYLTAQQRASEFWATLPPKSEYNEFVVNCTGYNVFNSKNCRDCIEVNGAQNSRFLCMMWDAPVADCYDLTRWGVNITESYEGCIVGENASRLLFCQESGVNLHDAQYCKLSTGGAHHLGCVSMKKGEYAVFNKLYPKREYEDLVRRIRAQMGQLPYVDPAGRIYGYGEFFPPIITPFAYNESFAMNFFPKTPEAAKISGYNWCEIKSGECNSDRSADSLPDHIKDAPDSLLAETIACSACPRAYRIVSQELQLLRRMNMPLPRRCPFCRISEKLSIWVGRTKRVRRICNKCGGNMESPYDSSEAPIVWCKTCYQAEVT